MGKQVTKKDTGTWNPLTRKFWTSANWSQAERDKQAAAAKAKQKAAPAKRAPKPEVDEARLGELLADAATRPTATPQEDAAAPVEASTAPVEAPKIRHARVGPGFRAVAKVIAKASHEILRGEPPEIAQKEAENARRDDEITKNVVALNDFLGQHNLREDVDMVLAALAPAHEEAAVNFINVVEATRKAHPHLTENFVSSEIHKVSRPFEPNGDHAGDVAHLVKSVESLVRHKQQQHLEMPVWCTKQTPWEK